VTGFGGDEITMSKTQLIATNYFNNSYIAAAYLFRWMTDMRGRVRPAIANISGHIRSFEYRIKRGGIVASAENQ
jgi:hypothetical protein